MAEYGITTTAQDADGAQPRGWRGWFTGWLRGLAEAEETSLRLRDAEDGSPRDERDEDLRFAAFMTGPLY